jgi:hypothetical protein
MTPHPGTLSPRKRSKIFGGVPLFGYTEDMVENFQVFLSYTDSDEKWARKLCEYLEAAGFRVFDRQDQLFPGDNWHLEIGKALDTSNAMVVLISPAAMRSSWVRREIEYALVSVQYKDRLIPVEVEPTADFPWILRHMPWIKGKGNPEEAGPGVAELLNVETPAGNPVGRLRGGEEGPLAPARPRGV